MLARDLTRRDFRRHIYITAKHQTWRVDTEEHTLYLTAVPAIHSQLSTGGKICGAFQTYWPYATFEGLAVKLLLFKK